MSAAVEEFPVCDMKTRDTFPKRSQEGTEWYASQRLHEKGSAADWDNARRQFPERTEAEWVALFDRAPHIMAQILGDIYRETKALAEREAGVARIGRRPKTIDGNLDELHEMITPRYSMEPFAEACQALIDKAHSLRQFASRAGIHHHTIRRMMQGKQPLDTYRLEQIAKAGKVHPAYFREWREAQILDALVAVLAAKPHMSVRIHKQIRHAARA